MTGGGIFPAIFGTVALVFIMTIFVTPAGVFVAIYFSEYADRRSWFYYISRQAVNNLAGVPSIVFGLFGLGFFVQFVGKGIDRTFNGGELAYGQPALIWAALTMAVLTLPVVVVSVEEALQSVPRSYREASYALGSTKSQAVFRVVLPHAMPGVLTGSVLAVSRAAGEVAPILFVGAAYYLPQIPSRLERSVHAIGIPRFYHVYSIPGCRCHETIAVFHRIRVAGADFYPECRCCRHPGAHAHCPKECLMFSTALNPNSRHPNPGSSAAERGRAAKAPRCPSRRAKIQFLVWHAPCSAQYFDGYLCKACYGHHRPFRMREIHFSSFAEQDE